MVIIYENLTWGLMTYFDKIRLFELRHFFFFYLDMFIVAHWNKNEFT